MDPLKQFSQILQKLNPREKGLVFLVLCVLAILLAKFLLVDALGELAGVSKQKREIGLEIAKNQALLAELASGAQRKPASNVLDYRKANAGLGNFLRKVSGPGKGRRDFSVRKIASLKTERLPDFDRTQLEIELEGPFQSIGSFLEEMEASQFLTRVEAIHIFRMEKELRLCRARIVVNNFTWRDE